MLVSWSSFPSTTQICAISGFSYVPFRSSSFSLPCAVITVTPLSPITCSSVLHQCLYINNNRKNVNYSLNKCMEAFVIISKSLLKNPKTNNFSIIKTALSPEILNPAACAPVLTSSGLSVSIHGCWATLGRHKLTWFNYNPNCSKFLFLCFNEYFYLI